MFPLVSSSSSSSSSSSGCEPGELRCDGDEGKVCVKPDQVCDGVMDCNDRADEATCWRLSSTPVYVQVRVGVGAHARARFKRCICSFFLYIRLSLPPFPIYNSSLITLPPPFPFLSSLPLFLSLLYFNLCSSFFSSSPPPPPSLPLPLPFHCLCK